MPLCRPPLSVFALAITCLTGITQAQAADTAPSRAAGVVIIQGSQPSSLPTRIPTTVEGISAAQIELTINASDSEDARRALDSLGWQHRIGLHRRGRQGGVQRRQPGLQLDPPGPPGQLLLAQNGDLACAGRKSASSPTMKNQPSLRLCLRRSVHFLAPALLATSALAHDFRIGEIVIDHPYALAGSSSLHLKALRNNGGLPDRLLAASSPAATRIAVLHQGQPAVPQLAPGTSLSLRHDGPWQLALQGLKAPLKAGDEIRLTLQFERNGEVTVPVAVATPTGRHAH